MTEPEKNLLGIISDIGEQIPTSLSLRKVLMPFIKNILRAVKCDEAVIWLVDIEDPDFMKPEAIFWNLSNDSLQSKQLLDKKKVGIGKSLVGKVAKEKQILYLSSRKEIEENYPDIAESKRLSNLNSFMGVPILHENVLIGVIEVGSKSENVFTESDKAFICSLSAHMSAYTRNAKISGVLRDLTKCKDGVDEFLKQAANKIPYLVNARACSIFLRQNPGEGNAYLVASNVYENKFKAEYIFTPNSYINNSNKYFYEPGEGLTGWVLKYGRHIELPAHKTVDDRRNYLKNRFPDYFKGIKLPAAELKNKYPENINDPANPAEPESFAEKAWICIPVNSSNNDVIGVLRVAGKLNEDINESFRDEDQYVLEFYAHYIGILLDAHYYSELSKQKLLHEIVASLAAAIDAKDPYTKKHSQHVEKLCEGIGRNRGFSPERLNNLKMAALLHDVGKIGIPDMILSKAGQVNEAEKNMIEFHPKIGAQLVKNIDGLDSEIYKGILDHHEHFDGKGYPNGKSASEISEFGRIIAVADSFDAMTTNRPYKAKSDYAYAFDEIKKCRGKQFDPAIVDAFCKEFGMLYESLQSDMPDESTQYQPKQNNLEILREIARENNLRSWDEVAAFLKESFDNPF